MQGTRQPRWVLIGKNSSASRAGGRKCPCLGAGVGRSWYMHVAKVPLEDTKAGSDGRRGAQIRVLAWE